MPKKPLYLLLGPLLFLFISVYPANGFSFEEKGMIALLIWMLVWWITEVVDLAVTSLLPMLVIPAMGITSMADLAKSYAHPMVYLFFGGFLLALAIEKYFLHKRIALGILKLTGTSQKKILLGFMISTAFLSMWISNTSTTIMLLPMALSVITLLEEKQVKIKNLSKALIISIAWSANIGGMATLIGTPPNLVFAGFYKTTFDEEITFAQWIVIGLPISILLLTAAYFVLSRKLKGQKNIQAATDFIDSEYDKLGKLQGGELRVLIIFIFTALLWIIRPYLVKILPFKEFSDTSVALFSGLLLFVVPGNEKKPLIHWKDTKSLSWGILLLFGGGLALAQGMEMSGLLNSLAAKFSNLPAISEWAWILIFAAMGVWLTEIMSNLALVTAIMPVIAVITGTMHLNFFDLALPLTLGASCAFMLPMATPPNAIVFGSGRLSVKNMALEGLRMNLFATLIITLICVLLIGH